MACCWQACLDDDGDGLMKKMMMGKRGDVRMFHDDGVRR